MKEMIFICGIAALMIVVWEITAFIIYKKKKSYDKVIDERYEKFLSSDVFVNNKKYFDMNDERIILLLNVMDINDEDDRNETLKIIVDKFVKDDTKKKDKMIG